LIGSRDGNLGLDIILPLCDGLKGRDTSHVKDDKGSNGLLIVNLKQHGIMHVRMGSYYKQKSKCITSTYASHVTETLLAYTVEQKYHKLVSGPFRMLK
jgi:hypothetical protein